jgi:hypothetical protein
VQVGDGLGLGLGLGLGDGDLLADGGTAAREPTCLATVGLPIRP